MKKLYLEQQLVPLDQLPAGVNASNWPHQYKVRKVIGSTTPRVASTLTEDQAKEYCENVTDWVVEIV